MYILCLSDIGMYGSIDYMNQKGYIHTIPVSQINNGSIYQYTNMS